MEIKQYFKSVASAVMAPVVKSLSNTFPAYGAGFTMMMGGTFNMLGIGNKAAYSNKIFYTASNIFVRKITEAPIIFSEEKNKAAARKFASKYYSKSISNEDRAFIKAAVLTELENHELNDMFDRLGIEGMEDFWYNYNHGDGFLFFETLDPEFSRSTKPVAVHSLNRDRVTPVQSGERFETISHYLYTTNNGTQIRIDKDNMLHLKHWNPNHGDLKGLGVDLIANPDISLNTANTTAQGAAFENGGRGTLFSSTVDITSEGKRVGKMTVQEMADLKKTVLEDMSGARNNRRQKFTNNDVKVTPYGDTLAEMELVESEKSNWLNIFAIMGLPWALSPVGSMASENSVIVGYKSLVTNLCISELRKFDQKLSQKIGKWWPGVIGAHDLTEYSELAPDLKLMKETFGAPLLRVDEVRKMYRFDEIGGDEGNAILVPSGFMLLKDVISDEFAGTPNPDDENAPNSL